MQTPFVPSDLESVTEEHVDVTLRLRVLLPKEQSFPLTQSPWIRITQSDKDGGLHIEGRNFIVLEQLK